MTTLAIEEYQAAVMAAVMAARVLAPHDLDEMLRSIDHADAVGAILDPTLYRAKASKMHEDRELLEAARPLWAIGRKLAKASA